MLPKALSTLARKSFVVFTLNTRVANIEQVITLGNTVSFVFLDEGEKHLQHEIYNLIPDKNFDKGKTFEPG